MQFLFPSVPLFSKRIPLFSWNCMPFFSRKFKLVCFLDKNENIFLSILWLEIWKTRIFFLSISCFETRMNNRKKHPNRWSKLWCRSFVLVRNLLQKLLSLHTAGCLSQTQRPSTVLATSRLPPSKHAGKLQDPLIHPGVDKPARLSLGFGDGHFYHAMRWRCFIFYNDAISIIFGHSLPSPSLRLFSQIIGIDYFAMFE